MGGSASTGTGPLDHPAMVTAAETLGSLVLDIDSNRLDATFLDGTGAVRDAFTLHKGRLDAVAPSSRAVVSNSAPRAPALTAPPDGATGVALAPTLEVGVSDPDGDTLTVSFYGRRPAGPDFAIVALPDTQNYVDDPNNAQFFVDQTEWIVDQIATRNIVFVTQLGDVVQHGDNGGDPIEWIRADAAMSLLEDPLTTVLSEGAFPISRSRAHTHRRHGHPLQTVPSAGLIERPQEKNRVDALR